MQTTARIIDIIHIDDEEMIDVDRDDKSASHFVDEEVISIFDSGNAPSINKLTSFTKYERPPPIKPYSRFQ